MATTTPTTAQAQNGVAPATSSRDSGLSWLRTWGVRILGWYGAVVFASRPLVGLLLALATLGAPDHGLCGLGCALLAHALGVWLSVPEAEQQAGTASVNALLFGLLLGTRIAGPMPLVVLGITGTFLICLLTRAYQNSVGYYGKLPTCSFPFVVAAVLLLYVARAQEYRWGIELITAVPHTSSWVQMLIYKPVHFGVVEQLTREVLLFGSSLAAIFFQHEAWAGALVAVALLASSRAAFALAVLGFAAMRLFCHALPWGVHTPDPTLGFNAILIAVAVGGTFFVPGRRTVTIMILGQAVAVLLGLACAAVGRATGTEFTALPFNLVATGTILALHGRALGACPCVPALAFADPEEAYAYHCRYQDRMQMAAIGLPVLERWQIVQGFDGNETHRQHWRYGLDLAAVDETGQRLRGRGVALEEHFTWQAVVRAPVDGIVAEVCDRVPDNVPGEINLEAPWGNYVTLYSAGTYIGLYHLKHGSIAVAPGQSVGAGTPLAQVGNSGRSAIPHLHMQVQAVPSGGAATLPFLLTNVVVHRGDHDEFMPFFRPQEGAIISDIGSNDALRPFVLPAHGDAWQLEISEGGRQRRGVWTMWWQLAGSVIITDETGDQLEYRPAARALEMWRFPTRAGSPLHLFALALADLPYHPREGMQWSSTVYGRSATPLLSGPRRFLAGIVGDLFATTIRKEFGEPVAEPDERGGKRPLCPSGAGGSFALPETDVSGRHRGGKRPLCPSGAGGSLATAPSWLQAPTAPSVAGGCIRVAGGNTGGLLHETQAEISLGPDRSLSIQWRRGPHLLMSCRRVVAEVS